MPAANVVQKQCVWGAERVAHELHSGIARRHPVSQELPMFSLFQERPPEENPSLETPVQKPHVVERLRAFIPHRMPFNPMSTALLLALVAVLVFGFHERRVAAHLSAQNTDAAAQLKDTQAQISALTAKLDSLATAQAN